MTPDLSAGRRFSVVESPSDCVAEAGGPVGAGQSSELRDWLASQDGLIAKLVTVEFDDIDRLTARGCQYLCQ